MSFKMESLKHWIVFCVFRIKVSVCGIHNHRNRMYVVFILNISISTSPFINVTGFYKMCKYQLQNIVGLSMLLLLSTDTYVCLETIGYIIWAWQWIYSGQGQSRNSSTRIYWKYIRNKGIAISTGELKKGTVECRYLVLFGHMNKKHSSRESNGWNHVCKIYVTIGIMVEGCSEWDWGIVTGGACLSLT